MSLRTPFDAWSSNYDAALERGLSLSGEGKTFFAQGRMRWLRRRLGELGCRPRRALDFGCGVGTSTPLLLSIEGVQAATGVDVSAGSIEAARSRLRAEGHSLAGTIRFGTVQEVLPDGEYDLAFCNGAFHHIAPGERIGAVKYVWDALGPGGVFALCENNPWNPGTRLVMSRIPFDKDAVMLRAGEARRLLERVGFEVLHTDFLFFFPRVLALLRRLEPALCGVPLGAQYMCVARKPVA
jgi:SAM-dependent methyltransferase